MGRVIKENKSTIILLLTAVFSSFLYIHFCYYTPRENYTYIFIQYALLFAISGYTLVRSPKISFKYLLVVGVLFRVIIAFSIPNLSNDFYRFIWDGQLLLNGFNPFLYIPKDFVELHIISNGRALVEGMGTLNSSHYSCYPVIKQLIFFVSALFSKSNLLGGLITMRVFILAAELGIVFFGLKIFKILKIQKERILLFWLNPFVIIEMTGNVHFESIMVFFLLAGLYFFLVNRIYLTAIFLALSVMVKLIPLLFLPILLVGIYRREIKLKDNLSLLGSLKNTKKPLLFLVIFTGILLLLVSPFLSSALLSNFMRSINLYFVNFEFNASIYYLLRAIGYSISGYNEIAIIGKILPLIVFTTVIVVSVFKENDLPKTLFKTMLFASVFYLFLATTVHPWYLILPLSLALFTRFNFMIVWSFTVILSYHAYGSSLFHENLYFIAIEYVLVFAFILYELRKSSLKGFWSIDK